MTTTSPERTAPDDTTKTPERGILVVFGGLLIAMLLASLDQTIFSTALPTIVGELHGVQHVVWVTTAYILASTIVMPVYGKLGDLIGRKWLFIGAIGLFLIGSIIGGLATDMATLIAGRAVQGLGGGGLMILALAIIADVVPARQRGKYNGIMGAVFAVSSVAGPLLGGFFTEGPGWRWAFWMNVPLAIAAMVSAVVFLRAPARRKAKARLDYWGMVLIAVATTCLVLTTTWAGSTYAWGSPQIIGLVIGAVVAAVAFVLVELRVSEPIMPMTLFRNGTFSLATIGGLITGISMFGAIAYLPTYLQMVTGAGATTAGLLMIPMMLGLLLTSTITGALISRTGKYKWYPVAGMVLVAASLFLLSTMTPARRSAVRGSRRRGRQRERFHPRPRAQPARPGAERHHRCLQRRPDPGLPGSSWPWFRSPCSPPSSSPSSSPPHWPRPSKPQQPCKGRSSTPRPTCVGRGVGVAGRSCQALIGRQCRGHTDDQLT